MQGNGALLLHLKNISVPLLQFALEQGRALIDSVPGDLKKTTYKLVLNTYLIIIKIFETKIGMIKYLYL